MVVVTDSVLLLLAGVAAGADAMDVSDEVLSDDTPDEVDDGREY